MKNKIYFWGLLAVIALVLAFGVIYSFYYKPRVKIGYLPVTDHLVLSVAQEIEREDFDSCKLEKERFKDWSSLQQAFMDGELDGVFVLAPLGMKMAFEMIEECNECPKVVLLGHRDGSAFVIRLNDTIETASDFKGKTIAIPDVYSIHNILLHKIVTQAGLDYEKDIIVEVIPPPYMPFNLIGGRIDAYIVAEPFGAEVEEYHQGKIFKLSREICPHHICCVFMLQEYFVKRYPEVVQELVDSFVSAGAFIEGDPAESADIGAKDLTQSESVIVRVLTMPKDRVCYYHLVPDKKEFQDMQDYLVDVMHVTDNKVDVDRWIREDFAEKAFEKMDSNKFVQHEETNYSGKCRDDD